jgi:hypothetical protein
MIWTRIESIVSGDRELEMDIRKVVDIYAEESETNEDKVGINRNLHKLPLSERKLTVWFMPNPHVPDFSWPGRRERYRHRHAKHQHTKV